MKTPIYNNKTFILKAIIFSISLCSLLIAGCSKDTGGSNSGGSTGGGGVIIPPRDTTPVVVPPPVVKTIYVDYFRFEFSNNNDTLRRAYFTNSVGNVVDLRLQYGTEASVKLNNFTDTAHDYTTYAGEFLRMKINNYKLPPHQFGFSTTPQDSTSLFFAKVKGFNKSRLGFDELNVIMDYFDQGSNTTGILNIHHFNYDSFPAYNLNKQFLINKLTTAKFGILRLAVEGNILQ